MSDQPQFPIFIPTLSRYDSRLTIKSLLRMGIDNWYAVVEAQEYEQYAAVIPREHIIVLNTQYKRDYQTLDELGMTKSTGPGPARNFIWDTAIQMGYDWHWVMDDNISFFARLTDNEKHKVVNGAYFRVMEDFCLRYENVVMAGPNYWYFAKRKQKLPPFIANTRIYSCNLICNDVPYRWRGRYNEDSILSLDMLSNGLCTVQFNTFLQYKAPTQTIKGGCDKVFYSKEGTYPKSEMLARVYPQYAKIVYKFGRVHHHVDYRPFRWNKLKRKEGIIIPTEPNEYGMKLVRAEKAVLSAG